MAFVNKTSKYSDRPPGFKPSFQKSGYGRPSYGGGRPAFGGSKPSFPRAGARQEVHQATCSICHEPCEVPFRPDGTRPIYCKNCLSKVQGTRTVPVISNSQLQISNKNTPPGDRRIDDLKQEMRTMQGKLDTIISMLEKQSE